LLNCLTQTIQVFVRTVLLGRLGWYFTFLLNIQKKTIQISILWANLYIRNVLVRRYAAACRSWNYNKSFTFRAFTFFAGVRFGNADFPATTFAEKSDFSRHLRHDADAAALWAFHPPAAEFIRGLDFLATIVTAKINHKASRRLIVCILPDCYRFLKN
jgi:hypothetical protein